MTEWIRYWITDPVVGSSKQAPKFFLADCNSKALMRCCHITMSQKGSNISVSHTFVYFIFNSFKAVCSSA